jgi:type IV pilus biogenesis protein CpaD/CtpE
VSKKILILVLILSLMAGLIAGCGGETEPADQETNQAVSNNENEPQVNNKVLEVEKILMDQLQPLPEMDKQVKIGALLISLTNP